MRTYSQLSDELLLTAIEVDAVGAVRKLGAKARLRIEDHPRTASLRKLNAELAKPLEVRWFDEYRTELDRAWARYRLAP
jgi:hypothetical protein